MELEWTRLLPIGLSVTSTESEASAVWCRVAVAVGVWHVESGGQQAPASSQGRWARTAYAP
jgi:hypothetical protein